MVKLRLRRTGRKKLPHYDIVVAHSTRSRDGLIIEKIGFYNPLLKTNNRHEKVNLNIEAYNGWIKKGAQPTDVVKKLFTLYTTNPNNSDKKTFKIK